MSQVIYVMMIVQVPKNGDIELSSLSAEVIAKDINEVLNILSLLNMIHKTNFRTNWLQLLDLPFPIRVMKPKTNPLQLAMFTR